jgi:hypothetical protein
MAAEEGSERELEDFLAGTGALNFGRTETEQPPPAEEEVVHDERPGFEPPPEEQGVEPPPRSPEDVEPEPPGEQEGEEEPEEQGDPHVIWATKKYGKDPDKWAKAAYDQERFISQLSADKRQAEEAAREAITYAQRVEAEAGQQTGMPLSAAEEEWIEQAMMNPAAYAYTAARQGNVQLYNGVIERLAIDNPNMAVHVGTQVQMALQDEMRAAQAQTEAAQQNGTVDFNTEMGNSFQRLGINVQQYGEAMWTKFEELGEYHPYTLAVLGGDPMQRDLAVSAVYDLVRAGQTTTRRVADTEREEQIRREGELRRNAAGVVTGAPHTPPTKQSPFFDAMEEEWRRRGQWHDEEG